jgi:hypothetical protein
MMSQVTETRMYEHILLHTGYNRQFGVELTKGFPPAILKLAGGRRSLFIVGEVNKL